MQSDSAAAGAEEANASVDAWRSRGARHFDPVRFHFIEALARRAAALDGMAQRLLEGKVASLLAAYGDDAEKARAAGGMNGGTAAENAAPGTSRKVGAQQEEPAPRGPLAALVDHIARHAPLQGNGLAPSHVAPGLASAPELKTLTYFRSTWSRLSADQRLLQSLAKVPENAGPLNSHHLVHRSLTLMRDLSPEYLNVFMSYVDALLWLDQANGSAALATKDVPRHQGDRKPGRGR